MIATDQTSSICEANPWIHDGLSHFPTMLARTVAWFALFGGLYGLEAVRVGELLPDDALAYKVAACFGFAMFALLTDWVLAVLLVALAGFIGWHAVDSTALTAGAALVVSGLSPVLAFLLGWSARSPEAGRRGRPNWLAEDPFFDSCGRRR